ncbi:hypothetical protein Syun_004151 [Stephania yunnanensis]|uniref:Uncharacterized protein n=1 Tax=Stephania yunnanensis TaxID=152371 RepID=A0AAP0L5T4_9MAGN
MHWALGESDMAFAEKMAEDGVTHLTIISFDPTSMTTSGRCPPIMNSLLSTIALHPSLKAM